MIKIREANTNDIETITNFQLSMAKETENLILDINTLKKGVAMVFEMQMLGKYYIAETDNKIVGSLLTTFEWSDWRNGLVLWIQSVYVLPEYRKNGVFKALYYFVKDMVWKSDKYTGIRLYVDKTNITAQKVYNALGMNGEHYTTFEAMKSF